MLQMQGGLYTITTLDQECSRSLDAGLLGTVHCSDRITAFGTDMAWACSGVAENPIYSVLCILLSAQKLIGVNLDDEAKKL